MEAGTLARDSRRFGQIRACGAGMRRGRRQRYEAVIGSAHFSVVVSPMTARRPTASNFHPLREVGNSRTMVRWRWLSRMELITRG